MSLSAAEWKRKAVHAAMGAFALTLRWLDWRQAALLAALALFANLFLLPRFSRSIYRDPSRRRDVGIVAYPATVLALVVIFRGPLVPIAAAVWAMMACGDPAASISGKLVGGPRLPWNREKTWIGFLSNWAVGGAVAIPVFRFVAARALTPDSVFLLLTGAAVYAILESLPAGIDDNLVAGLPAALVLYQLSARWDRGSPAWAGTAPVNVLVALAVNAAMAAGTRALGVVSTSGAIAGALAGLLILSAGGWKCYAILWTFFLLGTAATRWNYRRKMSGGIAQSDAGRRGARHVLANVGVAAVLLLLGVRPIAFVAALAAALADTLGTEIGGVYGRSPRSPLTWKRLEPGTPGAVSLPGAAAGFAGAGALGIVAAALGLVAPAGAAIVAAAGVLGSMAESAAVDVGRERGIRIDHEFANAFNTFAGAMIALEILLSLEKGSLYLPIES